MGLKAKNLKINGVEYSLSGNVDVVDNLETADSTSALSANQGKILNDKIEEFESESVVANYDKETGTMKLEFNVPVKGIVEDTLESTNSDNALSANQGKILNDNINTINDNLFKLDYKNKVKLTLDSFPYTVPKRGILILEVTPEDQKTCSLRIYNGNINLIISSYGGTSNSQYNVYKDEVLTLTASVNLSTCAIAYIPYTI